MPMVTWWDGDLFLATHAHKVALRYNHVVVRVQVTN